MIYNLHSKPHTLDHHEKLETHHPKFVWKKYENNPRELKKREAAIAKDARYSYYYARNVLRKPFPLGEPAIAKETSYSHLYAYDVLKKPFPLGEPAIAKDASYSYFYAMDVLEKPFPLGEPVIAEDLNYYKEYIEEFPEREQAILELRKNKRL